MLGFGTSKTQMIDQDRALPGRDTRPFTIASTHAVLGNPLEGPWPDGFEVAYFGLGCFWGAERKFWRQPGVYSTAVGYMGGFTRNPTYEETCTGRTGHTEAVMVVYDPSVTSYEALLKEFWEIHDPTTPNRQGNDIGTQYRSAVYTTTPDQAAVAEKTRAVYQGALDAKHIGAITTEIRPAAEVGDFYYAEDHHQQYLYKVPHGYDCHANTGVAYPA